MKTLEQIVDDLWKPDKSRVLLDCGDIGSIYSPYNKDRFNIVNHLAWYSEQLSVPFYGYDVQEPIVKICKRILEKPNRFHLVKSFDAEWHTCFKQHRVKADHSWKVIQDKDTGQKFIRETVTSCATNPSFLTYDEKVLLTLVIDEWYNFMKESLAQKQIKLENKRKDKFRQEMIELYKDF